MNTSTIKTMLKTAGGVLQKNSPHILTGLGVSGLIGTAYFSWKAARKTDETIAGEMLETRKEVMQECWKYYVPPILLGSASVACIIGADCVNTKRQAALYALYSAAVEGAKEYQEKVIELVGEGKHQKIKDAIAGDKIAENPPKDNQIIVTGKGNVKCYDAFSGRYFWGDYENIRRVQNDLNQERINDFWVSLNDVYFALGLPPIKLGEEMGWNVDNPIDFVFTSDLDVDKEPVLVLDYEAGPRQDFRNLH